MSMASKTSVNWLIAAIIVAAILFIPLCIAYARIGDRIMFNFFAMDSMYYMAVANNYAKLGIPTMDGYAPTNGFHPLWGYMLMSIFRYFPITHHDQVYVVFGLSVLLVYAAYVMMSYSLLHIVGKWSGIIATLALLPGLYTLVFEPRRHSFGEPGMLYSISPFSAMNGMETPLSLLLWAAFFIPLISRFVEMQRHSPGDYDIYRLFPLPARICLAGIILARLDDIFLLVAIGLFILLQRHYSLAQKIRLGLFIMWPTALALSLYAAYNIWTVGLVAPVSASNKVGTGSIKEALRLHFLVLSGHKWGATDWWIIATRIVPSLVALCAGILGIIYGWRHRTLHSSAAKASLRGVLFIIGIFLFLKSLFYLLWVHPMAQGYWYYFTMTTAISFIAALVFAFFLKNHSQYVLGSGILLTLIVCFQTANQISHMTSSSHNNEISFDSANPCFTSHKLSISDVAYNLWVNSEVIRNYIQKFAPDAKLIENTDGMFAYLLDMPAEAVSWLAASAVSVQYHKERGFWRSVISRGYTILPVYGYARPQDIPEIRATIKFKPLGSSIAYYLIELQAPPKEQPQPSPKKKRRKKKE